MGGEISQAMIEPDKENMTSQFFSLLPDNYMDVGIEDALLMYSGINSTAHLVQYSSGLKAQWESLPAFTEKAAGVLKGFTPVPNAVGLGAFIISIILQVAFSATMGPQGPSTTDALRRVFAEEKALHVRDLIMEYLKRYEMHLRNDRQLLVDSEQLETQLSLQLTKLRNSMLVDKQMNSPAVKQWVNGAAFHAQVLIHIARLRKGTEMGIQGFEDAKRAASNALDIYNRHMMDILEKYKEYKMSTFKLVDEMFFYSQGSGGFRYEKRCSFKETELNCKFDRLHDSYCDLQTQSYLNYIFSNHNDLKEIKEYFSNLNKNLEILVNQKGYFKIQ